MRVVAVAGGFDTLRIGHTRHMQAAKALGDYLVVIVSTNKDLILKKGYYNMPFEERVEIIGGLRYVDEIIPSMDGDGTVAKTLRFLKPNIFAKGGDRTPDNMPRNEIETCSKIGCEIRYGIGGLITSSTELERIKLRNVFKNLESYGTETKEHLFFTLASWKMGCTEILMKL